MNTLERVQFSIDEQIESHKYNLNDSDCREGKYFIGGFHLPLKYLGACQIK